jgi:hypothetical protein
MCRRDLQGKWQKRRQGGPLSGGAAPLDVEAELDDVAFEHL